MGLFMALTNFGFISQKGACFGNLGTSNFPSLKTLYHCQEFSIFHFFLSSNYSVRQISTTFRQDIYQCYYFYVDSSVFHRSCIFLTIKVFLWSLFYTTINFWRTYMNLISQLTKFLCLAGGVQWVQSQWVGWDQIDRLSVCLSFVSVEPS